MAGGGCAHTGIPASHLGWRGEGSAVRLRLVMAIVVWPRSVSHSNRSKWQVLLGKGPWSQPWVQMLDEDDGLGGGAPTLHPHRPALFIHTLKAVGRWCRSLGANQRSPSSGFGIPLLPIPIAISSPSPVLPDAKCLGPGTPDKLRGGLLPHKLRVLQ